MLIIGPLLVLLAIAAWFDVRSYRIPNLLTVPGALLGIALNVLLPTGIGVASSLSGLGLALIGLMPLYLLRIWGAGDVKLMAVVGAFLGPAAFLGSLLATMVAGGVMAVVVALRRRSLALLCGNLHYMLCRLLVSVQVKVPEAIAQPAQSAGKVAYALPILLGTTAYLAHLALR